MNEVNSWSLSHALLVVQCSRLFLNRELLLDKLKPIVDSKLLSVIESFFFIDKIAKVDLTNENHVNFYINTIYQKYEGVLYDFNHHYGECYEDGVIPMSYHSLRYELYNFLMDEVDIALSGIQYARYYEYILIPIRNIYLQEYTESSANEDTEKIIKKISLIFSGEYNINFIIYHITKGGYGISRDGFRFSVDSDGNCNIEEYMRPPFMLESGDISSNAYDGDDEDDYLK